MAHHSTFRRCAALTAILLVGAAALAFWGGGTMATVQAGQTRTLAVTWDTVISEPGIIHHGGGLMHAAATTSFSTDRRVKLEVWDSSSVLLQEFEVEGDPLGSVLTADQFAGLDDYASGSQFTITATFFASDLITVLNTITQNFTKP